jgi:hypothetical protein
MSIRRFSNLIKKIDTTEIIGKYYLPYIGYCAATGASLGCINVMYELHKNKNQEKKIHIYTKLDMLYTSISVGCGAGVMFGIFGPFSMVGLMILGYDELVNNKKN